MKKIFAAICCMLLVGGSVVAQEETATPVADTPVATQEAAPVVEAPMVETPGSVMQGTVVNAPMTTMPMATQGCGCGTAMSVPVVTGVPIAAPAPVINSGCSSCGTVAAAPVMTTSTCCNNTRTRRYFVRSTVSSVRSRVGSRRSCCN